MTSVAVPSIFEKTYRCPACNKRLFDGVLIGEIWCPRCKEKVRFDITPKKRILLLALCAEMAQTMPA